MDRGRKLGAAAAGIVTGAAALWASLLVLLVAAFAAEHPDPTVANGDPCCGHPDTWGEVAAGTGWTAVLAFLDGLLFALAGAFLWRAAKSRWPRWRRLLLVPALLATASVVAVAIAQAT